MCQIFVYKMFWNLDACFNRWNQIEFKLFKTLWNLGSRFEFSRTVRCQFHFWIWNRTRNNISKCGEFSNRVVKKKIIINRYSEWLCGYFSFNVTQLIDKNREGVRKLENIVQDVLSGVLSFGNIAEIGSVRFLKRTPKITHTHTTCVCCVRRHHEDQFQSGRNGYDVKKKNKKWG